MATTPELIAYLQEKIPLGQLPETVKLSELLWHEMDKLWQLNSLFEQSYKERQDILAASLVANQTISRELGLAFYYGWAFRQLVEVYRP